MDYVDPRFESYYWEYTELDNLYLIKAFKIVKAFSQFEKEKVLQSFHKLLSSDSVIAQGIAFDWFAYGQTITRWGIDNPYRVFAPELLAKARAQLQTPPITAVDQRKQTTVGANHASAFGVIQYLGDSSDLPLIEPILRSSRDIDVLIGGCNAARSCWRESNQLYQGLIEILSQMIFDESLPLSVRESAIEAFQGYLLPETEESLVHAVRDCPWHASARAALILAVRNLPKYFSVLEEVERTWPAQENIYTMSEVREMLKNHAQTSTTDNSVDSSSTITEEQPNERSSSTTEESEPLTARLIQERFEISLPQWQKASWCEQINSQYGHFRQGTNTGFTIPKRREAIEDVYDHFFPNAVIGFEPEELQQWLSSGYQSHPNYGIEALQAKTISNLRKPDAQDTDAIIALATQDASVVEPFFCELLGIEREES
jgi:hypothetical protein